MYTFYKIRQNVYKMCRKDDKMCRKDDKMCRKDDKMCRKDDKMCRKEAIIKIYAINDSIRRISHKPVYKKSVRVKSKQFLPSS